MFSSDRMGLIHQLPDAFSSIGDSRKVRRSFPDHALKVSGIIMTRLHVLVAILVALSAMAFCAQHSGRQLCDGEDSAEEEDLDLVEKLRPISLKDAARAPVTASKQPSKNKRNRFPRHLHHAAGSHLYMHPDPATAFLNYHLPHFLPHQPIAPPFGSTNTPLEFHEYKEYPALIPLMASLNIEALSDHLAMFDEKPHASNTVLVDPYSLYRVAGMATADGPTAEFGQVFGRRTEPKFYLMPAFLFKLLLFTGLNQASSGQPGVGGSAESVPYSFNKGRLGGRI